MQSGRNGLFPPQEKLEKEISEMYNLVKDSSIEPSLKSQLLSIRPEDITFPTTKMIIEQVHTALDQQNQLSENDEKLKQILKTIKEALSIGNLQPITRTKKFTNIGQFKASELNSDSESEEEFFSPPLS
jgi:hypothetical protein